MEYQVFPVILSGGYGKRLWPLSKPCMPKQFLPLLTENSLFLETINRVVNKKIFCDPLIVCNSQHHNLIESELKKADITPKAIIVEPCSKNTAPAITLAAEYIKKISNRSKKSILVVMPSDHYIEDNEIFTSTIEEAIKFAKLEKIITIGVTPTHPATGYGYIKLGTTSQCPNLYNVGNFIEKPNKHLAEELLDKGNYLWNSGIFIFTVDKYLQELKAYEKNILDSCKLSIKDAVCENNVIYPNVNHFKKCSSNSVDYAVMEKTKNACVIKLDTKWSDVGTWNLLSKVSEKDKDGNYLQGKVLSRGVKNSYVNANSRLVALNNIEDLIVVETNDAIFISEKNETKEENVKHFYDRIEDGIYSTVLSKNYINLNEKDCQNVNKNRLLDDKDFSVDLLKIEIGEKISLPITLNVNIHCIVIKGVIKVIDRDKTSKVLKQGESIKLFMDNENVYYFQNIGTVSGKVLLIKCSI